MPGVTRDQLREAILFRADLPTNSRVLDAQLNTLINRSMLRLQGILQRFDSEDYFKVPVALTKVAATSLVLPDTIGKIIHVLWQDPWGAQNNRDYLRLEVATQEDIECKGATAERWSSGEAPKWYVTTDGANNARQLRFVPDNTQDEELLLMVQTQLVFSDDTTPVVLEYAWEEWVVLDIMISLRMRDKQDASDIFAERARTEAMIRETAPERFKDAKLIVRDEDDEEPGHRYPMRIP